MTAARVWPDQGTHPSDITGPALAALQKTEGDALWNGVLNQVSSVGGTVNAITGVCVPPLTAAYQDGQTFRLVPAGNNTLAVQVNIDSRGLTALKDEDGGALSADDIVLNRPIMFWYDATNSYFRLCNPTQADLLAAMAASISVASFWDEIGDTTVGAAVASIEHQFTAGTYSKILVSISGLSSANSSIQLVNTLRNSGGAIVTLTTAGWYDAIGAAAGTGTISAGDIITAEANYLIDLVSSTKYHYGRLIGGGADTGGGGAPTRQLTGIAASYVDPVNAAGHATAPDRIRIAFSAGNIDAGRVITKGLKA